MSAPPAYPGGQPMMAQQTTTVVVQEEGFLAKSKVMIPKMIMPLAIMCCVFNFLFPGLGTIIAAFIVLCPCPASNPGMGFGLRIGSFFTNLIMGCVQMFLSLFIIGWVWSIMWGLAFVASSADTGKTTVISTTVHPVPV
eukprot:Opistho-1_new@92796